MKRKIALFCVVILSFFLVFLLQTKVTINKENSKYINKTIEIKEQLLNKVVDGRSVQGKIYTKNNSDLKDIELVLFKEENGKYKKESVTYTDKNGNYEFNNLKSSVYKIDIDDNEEYKLLNTKALTLNNNLTNINLEAIEKGKFKAEIKKYIKEIKIINNNEEKMYYYTKENNAIIPIQNVKNLTGEVTYEFEVTNQKDINGYVKVIKDKLPEGLKFDKEKNKDWKEKNGYLYTSKLSEKEFSPKETKRIELVLDIENTNEGKTYLNKVSITGDVYHNVTFKDGTNTIKEEKVVDGDLLKEEELTKQGYKFIGWFNDKNCTKKYKFDDPITEDTIIYAGWKKEIKVDYIINDEIYLEETKYEKDKISRPTDPQIEGYNFINWYKDSNYNELFDFNEELLNDTMIYGKIDKAITYYTVTYMVGNTEYKKETLQEGTLIENIIGPSKDNLEKETRVQTYSFNGWYIDEDLTIPYDFTRGIDKDTVLYGKYDSNLVCKTRDNIHIPTKEEIINSIDFNIVNITDTTLKNNKEIANNFIIELDSETDTYSINGYEGDYPNNLVIPDQIKGKDVTVVSGIGNGQTFDKVKISSKVKTISNSFNGVIINNKLNFDEAISLENISNSFQGLTIDEFNFSNSINLTNISGMQGIKCDTFNFGNVLSLERLEDSVFNGLSATALDFGNAVNLNYIGKGSFSDIELDTLNLSKLFSLENIPFTAFINNNYNGETHIRKIVLNTNLKNIGINAFYGTGVEEIDFECAKPTLEVIDSLAFDYNHLVEIELKDFPLLNTIDLSAFGQKEGSAVLEKLVLKDLPSLVYLYQGPLDLKMNPNKDNTEILIENVGVEDLPLSPDNISTHLLYNTSAKKITIQNNPNLKRCQLKLVSFEDFADISINNNPELEIINSFAFSVIENNISFTNLPKLKELKELAVNAYYGNKISLKDLPSLEIIGERAFSAPQYVNGAETDVELINLPSLTTIETEAFDRNYITSLTLENLPSLTTIKDYAFTWLKNDTTINLDSTNVPSLTTIGFKAFSGSTSTFIDLIIKDLPNLNQTNLLNNFTTTPINNLVLENLPSLTTVGSSGGAPIKHLTIKNCENLGSSNFSFPGRYMETLVLENLPSFTYIQNTAFTSNLLTELDLSKLENLTEIQSIAFAGNTNLTTVKLPGSLTTINDNAFSGNNISCIEIQGDNTRFNDRWESIGFPNNVSPSTCVFVDEESNNLLSNIFNINRNDKKVYNVLLYKMDDDSLIDNTVNYKLEKLVGENFEEIKVAEDLENVGNYIIDNTGNDKIKSFNNKVYLSNIESGTYRLVGNNKTLTFIIETNDEITGNAKISNAVNNPNVMSFSEATFTTIIQTGIKRLNYLLIILVILLGLVLLTKRKRKLD